MEATTWLDRQLEQTEERRLFDAGAALPLILWTALLIGTSAAPLLA